MKNRMLYPSCLMLIPVILFGAISPGFASEINAKVLIDFSDAAADKQWLSVNDNVMGGVSKGRFRVTENKTLEFSGEISLQNNGGFASIRTRPAKLDLAGYDTIALRVKGDGRSYYFDLRTPSGISAGSYRAPVKTIKDTWQEVRIPLNGFQYAAFGKLIPFAGPLVAANVQSVGFTLADKQAGKFRLEVQWIKAEKGPTTNTDDPSDPPGDIVDTAVAAGQFKTLVAAVEAAGLVESLKSEGPLTVFAPNDQAFAKLPNTTLEELLQPENRDKLRAILTYHVVPGKILLGSQSFKTLQGQSISIEPAMPVKINGVKILATDIMASNGVIHIIDSVLIPTPTQLTPRQGARQVIELAIERGVPLFNEGQPAACAAIYEVAIESLLKSQNKAIRQQDYSVLQDALSQIRNDEQQTPSQKAWILRRALDLVYESLGED